MTGRRLHGLGALLLLPAAFLASGCASDAPVLPADAPISAVLASRGRATFVPGDRPEEVVVFRDRHFLGGGITFVDDDLRRLQRDHRRVVADLVGRGFTLMGAEWRRGPLPKDDVAEAHREAVRDVLAEGDDLNRWSIYQPLRYEVEFAGRLEVVGVEDAEMYDADVAALERLLDLERVARRNDTTTGPSDAEVLRERLTIRRAMTRRLDARGEAAARNLLAEMEARGTRRALLLVGAAHVPGASRALAAAGVPHFVFTAPGFERRPNDAPADAR